VYISPCYSNESTGRNGSPRTASARRRFRLVRAGRPGVQHAHDASHEGITDVSPHQACLRCRSYWDTRGSRVPCAFSRDRGRRRTRDGQTNGSMTCTATGEGALVGHEVPFACAVARSLVRRLGLK